LLLLSELFSLFADVLLLTEPELFEDDRLDLVTVLLLAG
jgi:hypothetical protein